MMTEPRLGPIATSLGTDNATDYTLIGRRRGETWTVIGRHLSGDYQPSPVCIASWPELKLVRIEVRTTYNDVARWRNGVLVGRGAMSAPHGACP